MTSILPVFGSSDCAAISLSIVHDIGHNSGSSSLELRSSIQTTVFLVALSWRASSASPALAASSEASQHGQRFLYILLRQTKVAFSAPTNV
jgi:hypothetical protein